MGFFTRHRNQRRDQTFLLTAVLWLTLFGTVQGYLYSLQDERRTTYDGVTVVDRRGRDAPINGPNRHKRDISEDTPWKKVETDNLVKLDLGEFVLKNDSNNIAFVFWKQHTTDVIFILTCNEARTSSIGNLKNKGCESFGNFYQSDNLGQHFWRQDQEHVFKGYWIHSIYLSILNKNFVIAADYHNNTLFITQNEGANFTKVNLEFSPTFIKYHPTKENMVAAFDYTNQNTLWWSEDYGMTWRMVSINIKKYFWTDKKLLASTNPHNIDGFYFERVDQLNNLRDADGKLTSSLVHFPLPTKGSNKPFLMFTKANSLVQDSVHAGDEFVLMQKVSDYDIYVIRPSHENYPVKVTYKNKNTRAHLHHAVLSTENNEILFSVFHPDDTVTVYLSDHTGRNMHYVADDVIGASLKNKTIIPKVDFYRVKGSPGIYIFNKKNNGTFITFDKGSTWEHPTYDPLDANGKRLDETCKLSGYKECNLNLYLSVEQIYSTYTSPLMSKESAPGLIIAQGRIGGSKQMDVSEHHVFISTDGGRYWVRRLDSSYGYAIMNHGKVIAAMSLQFTIRQEIKFSTDYGKTWLDFAGTHRYSRIAAIITDSTAKSLVVNVFGFLHQQPIGSDVNDDQWVVWKFNFTGVFDRMCTVHDYDRFYPAGTTCDAGTRTSFLRSLPLSKCYSPEEFDDKLDLNPCTCTKRDFQCEETYITVPRGGDTYICKTVALAGNKGHRYCLQNGLYYKTKGYRKRQGNKCTGGVEKVLMGTYEKCQTENPEASIHASRTTAGLNEKIDFMIADSLRTFDTTFKWDFGDGTQIKGDFNMMRETQHTYTKIGHYGVRLIAENSKASYTDTFSVIVLDQSYQNAFIFYQAPIVKGQEIEFELRRLGKDGTPLSGFPPHSTDIKFLWSFQGVYRGDTNSHKVKHTFEESGNHELQIECQIISPINVQTVVRMVRIYKAAYAVRLIFSPYLMELNTKTATWENDFMFKLKMFVKLRYNVDDTHERLFTDRLKFSTARLVIGDLSHLMELPSHESAESICKRIVEDVLAEKPLLLGYHREDIHVMDATDLGFLHGGSSSENDRGKHDGNGGGEARSLWVWVVVVLVLFVVLASIACYLRMRRNKNGGSSGVCCYVWRDGVFVRKDKRDIMQKKLVFHADEDCVGLEGPDLPQYVSD